MPRLDSSNSWSKRNIAAGASLNGELVDVTQANSVLILASCTVPNSTSATVCKCKVYGGWDQYSMADTGVVIDLKGNGHRHVQTVPMQDRYMYLRFENVSSPAQIVSLTATTTLDEAPDSVKVMGVDSLGTQNQIAVDADGRLQMDMQSSAITATSSTIITSQTFSNDFLSSSVVDTNSVNTPITVYGSCTLPINWYIMVSHDGTYFQFLAETHSSLHPGNPVGLGATQVFSHTFTTGVRYIRIVLENTQPGTSVAVEAFVSFKS